MVLTLNMEFISLLRQDFEIFLHVLRTRENSCFTREINSLFNIKLLNILYIFTAVIFTMWQFQNEHEIHFTCEKRFYRILTRASHSRKYQKSCLTLLINSIFNVKPLISSIYSIYRTKNCVCISSSSNADDCVNVRHQWKTHQIENIYNVRFLKV